MRINADLSLRQSLSLTNDMRLAIDMLSMSSLEIWELIDQEIGKNPSLKDGSDHHPPFLASQSSFEVALETVALLPDFRNDLLQQIRLEKFNWYERNIAYFIIHSLDERGLLLDHEEVYGSIIKELHIFPEWIDSVRLKIMKLHPLGCGAISIEESLCIQYQQYNFLHDHFLRLLKDPEKKFNREDIELIRKHPDYKELRILRTSPIIGAIDIEPIHVDILVEKGPNGLLVSHLKKRSSDLIAVKIARLTEQHKRASFLLRALKFREDGLLNVAAAIVEHQRDWFLGKGALKPLSLHSIRDICGLHESSISRLSRNKYLSCDKGIFELKHFFSSKALVNEQGEECSTAAIKEKIRALVNQEDKLRPLSDQQLAKILSVSSMPIARRTVAKYRESLKLLKARDRRLSW